MMNIVRLTAENRNVHTVNSDVQKLPAGCKEKPSDHKLSNHAYNPLSQFQKILYHRFPHTFAETLMDRFMIEGVTASRWILEYIKFICLSTLSKSELFPSDIVDRVWHLHMTSTKHYRDMINSIEGIVPDHTQECCHKVDDGDQKEVYQDTLTFYEAVYNDSPPEDIWPDPDEEFEHDKSELICVNLYR